MASVIIGASTFELLPVTLGRLRQLHVHMSKLPAPGDAPLSEAESWDHIAGVVAIGVGKTADDLYDLTGTFADLLAASRVVLQSAGMISVPGESAAAGEDAAPTGEISTA